MDASLLKYNLLNSFEKEEVRDFIDFLFNKKKQEPKSEPSEYKNKLLSVSIWSDKDIKEFESNNKLFDRWLPATW